MKWTSVKIYISIYKSHPSRGHEPNQRLGKKSETYSPEKYIVRCKVLVVFKRQCFLDCYLLPASVFEFHMMFFLIPLR